MSYHSLVASAHARWRLQDAAPTATIVDELGNFPGTLIGATDTAAVSVAGPRTWLPQAISFTGTSYISLPAAAGNLASNCAFAGWFWLANNNNTGVLFSTRGGLGNYELLRLSSNRLLFESNTLHPTSSNTIPAETWFHLAYVIAANQGQFYINGQPLGAPVLTETALDVAQNCLIGRRADMDIPTGYLVGHIADLAVFDRALTAAEALQLVAGPEPTNSSPPSLSGTLYPGYDLSCSPGVWNAENNLAPGNALSFSYQWTRDQQTIPGATSDIYELAQVDLGKQIRCEVTPSNDGGAGTAVASAPAYIAPAIVPNLKARSGYRTQFGVSKHENLLKHSQDFAQTDWQLVGYKLQSGYQSPDGSFTAFKLAETGQYGNFSLNYPIELSPGRYTLSLHFKPLEGNLLVLNPYTLTLGPATTSVRANSFAGQASISFSGAAVSSGAIDLPDGWHRVQIVFDAQTVAGSYLRIRTNVFEAYTGTSGRGILIWGAQLHAGEVLLPYQETQSEPQLQNRFYAPVAWYRGRVPYHAPIATGEPGVDPQLDLTAGVASPQAEQSRWSGSWVSAADNAPLQVLIAGSELKLITLRRRGYTPEQYLDPLRAAMAIARVNRVEYELVQQLRLDDLGLQAPGWLKDFSATAAYRLPEPARCLGFDASSHLQAESHPLAGATSCTLAVWVKPTTSLLGYPVLISSLDAGEQRVELRLQPTTRRLQVELGDGKLLETSQAVPSDAWTHVACTLQQQNADVRAELFINGLPAQLGTITNVTLAQAWGDQLVLGGRGKNGQMQYFLHGWLQDAQLYDLVMPDAYLRALGDRLTVPKLQAEHLVAWYPLEESFGFASFNSAANQYHLEHFGNPVHSVDGIRAWCDEFGFETLGVLAQETLDKLESDPSFGTTGVYSVVYDTAYG